MRVENMRSHRSGNPVPNQFIIYDDDGSVIFQSYTSIIAKIDPTKSVQLDKVYWNHSRTTSKYLHQFLYEFLLTLDSAKDGIASGRYTLADLN